VEQPNYYFKDTGTIAWLDLDVLMLTQGYRRFQWKQVLDNNNPPLAYQPEKGLEISGMITNLFGKPIANGTVTLLPSKGGPLLSSQSDDKGIFHFPNLIFMDTTRFVLSAVNTKGRNSTKITYVNNKPEPVIPLNRLQEIDTTMAVYLDYAKKERNEVINYGLGKGTMLKEVKIREKKRDDQYRTQSFAGAGHADQVMHADEIERIQGPLSTSLLGRLRGVTFINEVPVLTQFSAFNMYPMLVIVDGAEMLPGFNINFLNVNEIETIEVLKYANSAAYGMAGANGVLVITTKQRVGTAYKDIASIGILPIAPIGFYKAREFYSPKYDNTGVSNKQKDLRSTIYWKPELVTDKDGNASFGYYNADGTGTYKVVIEGIDNKGNLGRQVYRYKVE
jgi:TonB-dependent SusC/RagA subfamily outer membrane receptor